MRIQNGERLSGHGNIAGRQAMVAILEAGLQAADPYYNTLKLMRVEGGRLFVGNPAFEPSGAPYSGEQVFDLAKTGKILVVGAAKGVQRVAKAIEEVLGDRLTGGHVIDKHGAPLILERIGVTFGGHPVPDEGCLEGCRRILEALQGLTEDDVVFTIAGNGVSSLLTLPVPGVSLEDVRRTTYLMQIERGAPTLDLNAVRNHLDLMKGGRLSRYLQPARAVHLVSIDAERAAAGMGGYQRLMHHNRWLHNLPDDCTFADAVAMLTRWEAWDEVPASVREHLLRADPTHESVKASEFATMSFRVYGLMPRSLSMVPAAQAKAAELGFKPFTLCAWLQAEASHTGTVVACVATSVEREGLPFEPPCALFTTGELLVTVGKETGIGGRNQEYALSAALSIAGSKHIVMGAVDSDGNDGPGGQFVAGAGGIPTLAGGIVDGETLAEAQAAGIDIREALKHHNSTPALWQLDSGVQASYNISITDLGVTLILGRSSTTGGPH
jgi:glycerate-2-kinase